MIQNKEHSPGSGVGPLMWAQAQVVFNDNAAKIGLIGLAQMVATGGLGDQIPDLCAALLVLPFILFSPVCGWLSDRVAKTTVLRQALLFQLATMGVMVLGVVLHSLPIGLAGFFLLAVQATIFSPAKQGILKELVGHNRLNQAASLMEASTIVAILVGAFGGALLLDGAVRATGGPWSGALVEMGVLTLLCLGSWWLIGQIPRQRPQTDEPFRWTIFTQHFHELARLAKKRELLGAALGSAWFYSLGGLFYLILVQEGRELHGFHKLHGHPDLGAASNTGGMFLCLGAGIVGGSLLYAGLARQRITLHFMPFCACGIALCLFLLANLPGGTWGFNLALFGLGLSGGMFVVPLNAYLQDRSAPAERARMLAAANLLTNLGGFSIVGVHLLLTRPQLLGLSVRGQIWVLAMASLVVAAVVIRIHWYHGLRLVLQGMARLLYRVQLCGLDSIPETGGVLLVSNHVSYVDAFLIPLFCPRRVTFMAFEALFKVPLLGAIMRGFGTIPVSPQRSREALRRATEAVARGEVVCIFPEGELTRTGTIMGFKRGFESVARKAGGVVVPIHLDSLWGSIFSFAGGRYFWKWPREIPRRIRISFGQPIPDSQVQTEEVRRQVLCLGEAAFGARPELQVHLGYAAMRRLRAGGNTVWLTDCAGAEPVPVTCRETLVGSVRLALRWRGILQGKRVGLALPPGRGAVLANLAVVLAGKVPVNLNLTASRGAAEASLRTAEIREVITVPAVQALFPKFPWPEEVRDLTAEMRHLAGWRLGATALACRLLPVSILARIFNLSRRGGNEEAVLLFTSGSSGDPKGVGLTHQNLQANVAQVGATELMRPGDRILGCLPLFHSFGSTFTLWLPLLRPIGLVTTPSALDAKKVGESARAGEATILLGTPTFYRSYARKVPKEHFAGIRLAVTGAEKLPLDVAQVYREKYGLTLMEGYGLTETAPTLSVNLPDPLTGPAAESPQKGQVEGSVGRLLPGIAYRLINPESRANVPSGGPGLLQVRGPNVFQGYLHEPGQTAEVLQEGWFNTGDLARVDADGFLFIEGRLSRFAKIAGEMVPLGKVEESIHQAIGSPAADQPILTVVSIPHPTKGESLVVLTVNDLKLADLKTALAAAGLPNLWIPRSLIRVPEIPVLGSGKIDFRACQRLAGDGPGPGGEEPDARGA